MLISLNSIKRNQLGISLIDSIVALFILSIALTSYVMIQNKNNTFLQSKILANETYAYSAAFARYINQNQVYATLSTAPNQPYQNMVQAFTPQNIISDTINGNWPTDLNTVNILGQTPCLITSENPLTGTIESIMFYVGSSAVFSSNIQEVLYNIQEVTNKAVISLGYIGAVVKNGTVYGSTGWSIDKTSPFLQAINNCGGSLPNYSVAVNLDLMLQWNQILQPATSILKLPDQGAINYQTNNGAGFVTKQNLPGHLINNNTIKTDVYFASQATNLPQAGVVIDNSDNSNPVQITVSDNGLSSYWPTLNIGNSTPIINTNLIAETLRPNQLMTQYTACSSSEIGKTVLDNGFSGTGINTYLPTNTLICSLNTILCTQNSSNTCYVPMTPTRINFVNANGLTSGSFTCPSNVPYLEPDSITMPQLSVQTKIYYKANATFQAIQTQNLQTYLSSTNYTMYLLPPITINYSTIGTYKIPTGFTLSLATIDYNNTLGNVLKSLGVVCYLNAINYGNLMNNGINYYVAYCNAGSSTNLSVAAMQYYSTVPASIATSVICSNMPMLKQ